MQALFLGAIVLEHYNHHVWVPVAIGILIAVMLLIVYLKAPLHHHEHDTDDLLVAIWVPIGAVVCYLLSAVLKLGPVIGAGITGTIGSYLPSFNKKSTYLKRIPVAIYCGAFVGMSGPGIASSIWFVLAAGLLTGVLLLWSKNLFLGVGGKLGTLAFISVSIVSLILYFLHKW